MLALLYGSLVGLSLGLTGGGGAIIAIPLLVYGLNFEFNIAVIISLGIVGATALFGALLQSRNGNVLWIIGTILGFGGILTIPFGNWIGDVVPEQLLIFLFAILMIFIGCRMIFGNKFGNSDASGTLEPSVTLNHKSLPSVKQGFWLLFCGGVVGVLSGTFGIGGGFFLVPAMDLVLRIPIEQATATSLVGIFLIASSGLLENVHNLASVDLTSVLPFFLGSAGGMMLGVGTKHFFTPRALEILFGTFVLSTAAYVLHELM